MNVKPSESWQALSQNEAFCLYESILRIRRAEERIARIYPTDKIQSPIHLCIGQEAVSAGVSHALRRQDHIYGTYRGHGLYIARGGKLNQLFAELYAKDTGCARGKGGSMHVIAKDVGLMGCSAIVASTVPLAVGDALAAKVKKEDRICVAFFGDGALGEGVVYESFNFAALKNLPVIFVCENNNYAVNSPLSDRHKQTELFQFAEPFGVTGERHIGHDASNVFISMKNAIQKVQKTHEPILLEYVTYRWYEHVGPGQDHQEAYRDKAKLQNALANDPLIIAQDALKKCFRISGQELTAVEAKIKKEIDEAVAFAETSRFPGEKALYENLFAGES